MRGLYDEDGIDGPFERGMSRPIDQATLTALLLAREIAAAREREYGEERRRCEVEIAALEREPGREGAA